MITVPFSAVQYDRLPVLFYNNKLRHYFMSASVASKSFHDMKKRVGCRREAIPEVQYGPSSEQPQPKVSHVKSIKNLQTTLQPTTGNSETEIQMDKQKQTSRQAEFLAGIKTNSFACMQADWHTGMQMGRQAIKQTSRQTDKQSNRQTNKQKNRKTGKRTNRQKDKQAKRQTDEQTNKHADKQTERKSRTNRQTQTEKKTDRKTGKQTNRTEKQTSTTIRLTEKQTSRQADKQTS